MREIQIKWEDLNSFKQDEILKEAFDVAVENFVAEKDIPGVIWREGHYFTGLTEDEEELVRFNAKSITTKAFEFPPIINLE